ncbi:MAG: hypothetical protein JRN02_00880 [Nitrososphaerota archaeon]|nr:hypothetical protein [Nitrososphaerota archaeon]
MSELTYGKWEAISPVMPMQTGRGKPKADDRSTLNAAARPQHGLRVGVPEEDEYRYKHTRA